MGEEKFEEIRNRKTGWQWGSWVFGFNGRTPHTRIQGMVFSGLTQHWVSWNFIGVVDKNGKRIEYVPTIYYGYDVLSEENQAAAGFVKPDGNVVRVFMDTKIGTGFDLLTRVRYSTVASVGSSRTPTPTGITADKPDIHSNTAAGSVLSLGIPGIKMEWK